MSSSRYRYANLKSAFLRFILRRDQLVEMSNILVVHGDVPCGLVIEKPVGPLLKLLRDILGLFMPLEPRLVLLMKTPALVFQGFGRQILLIRALLVVKDIEKCIRLDTRVQARVIEDRQRFLRIPGWRVISRFRLIRPWGLSIGCVHHVHAKL